MTLADDHSLLDMAKKAKRIAIKNGVKFLRPTDTPVIAFELKVAGRFRSVAEAARSAGVADSAIREATHRGTQVRGRWWRCADMPASCQPLNRSNRLILYCPDDDCVHVNATSVVFAHHPDLSGVKSHDKRYGREHMRLCRAVQRGLPYCGKTYLRVPSVRPGTVGGAQCLGR
jgi:hypothetical protein